MERAARLDAVAAGIAGAGIDDAIMPIPARDANMSELARVHDGALLDALAALSAQGGGLIDHDTAMSADSWAAATRAAGAGLGALDALTAGTATAAFIAARPPGHHATRRRAMGFCLVNSVAVTTAALVARGERVCVIDYDAHHGNGTQDIFWSDPNVLYVSLHQWPLYPGTGRLEEIGSGAAVGTTCNLPLPPGATGDVYQLAFDLVIEGRVAAFAPDWIVVSAGFDAHRADPLAGLALTAGDFAALAARACALAPAPGRTIVFLEGGYDLAALRDSVAATLPSLVGERAHPAEAPTSGGPGADAVEAARRFWERDG